MKRWFSAIAAAQIVFLGAQAACFEYWSAVGQKVELRVEPLDPRSLLLGNYMHLSYDISRPPRRGLSPGSVRFDRVPNRTTLYVELEPRKGGAAMTGLYTRRPSPPLERRVYLRGRKEFDGISYGLERYYIPESRSKSIQEIERALARRSGAPVITVEVAVARSGHGLIRRVLVDGQPLEF